MDGIIKRKSVISRQEDEYIVGSGWLWSAFLGGWLWALAMRNFYAFLISLIAGVFGNVFLGIFGRDLAISTRNFETKEQFIAVQKQWLMWGAVAFVINVATMIVVITLVINSVQRFQPNIEEIKKDIAPAEQEQDTNNQLLTPIGNQPTRGGDAQGFGDTLYLEQ